MVVVLPAPLTPTTRITKGRIGRIDHERPLDRAQDRDHRLAQRREQRIDVAEFLARDAPVQIAEDARGGLDADVGADQARLEIVEDLGIDLAARQDLLQSA